MTNQPLTVPNLPLASRSSRLLGQILDGIVAAAPFLVGSLISTFSDTLGAILTMAGIAWWFFYYFFADGFPGGQSFAKRWLGMQVVDAKTGAPCTFGQSFIRNLLLAILGPIDWLFIFGERHQRLGDKAAGTIVVTD
jgi:uncharacterized RDD family membrane protein YckC